MQVKKERGEGKEGRRHPGVGWREPRRKVNRVHFVDEDEGERERSVSPETRRGGGVEAKEGVNVLRAD